MKPTTFPMTTPRAMIPALLLLVGCSHPFDVDVPDNAIEFDPPPVYREWYALTAACVGRAGDFDRIRWFMVPGHGWDRGDDRVLGLWTGEHHIYISESAMTYPVSVRHEMLHDLGIRGHPEPPFNKCEVPR